MSKCISLVEQQCFHCPLPDCMPEERDCAIKAYWRAVGKRRYTPVVGPKKSGRPRKVEA